MPFTCSTLDGRSGAIFSDCFTFRYQLWRLLEGSGGPLCFIMLNPSTADETTDDPTIRRCIGFANRLNANKLMVVNLFGFRETDPKTLAEAADPVGPLNGKYLIDATKNASTVIAAWGANRMAIKRAIDVLKILEPINDIQCFGATKQGHPRHPLYLKKDRHLNLLQPAVPF